MGDTAYLAVALSLKQFGTVVYNKTAAQLTSYSLHCMSLLQLISSFCKMHYNQTKSGQH